MYPEPQKTLPATTLAPVMTAPGAVKLQSVLPVAASSAYRVPLIDGAKTTPWATDTGPSASPPPKKLGV